MQTFPADLCILSPRTTLTGTGDPNSLANVNTSKLPNGAQCYVIQTNQVYRLHKKLVAPVAGAVSPVAGPGAWVPESASAIFANSCQFGAGVPGTVTKEGGGAGGATSASAVPGTPLRSTDILFGGQLDPTVPTGISTSAMLDLVTFSPVVGVRIQWYNPTGGDIAVPDSLFYYFLVYRPFQ